MKNIYILLFAVLCCVALQAQLKGVKIYVNPGHGGLTSNDRHIATPGHYTCGHPLPGGWNGAAGFWESTSNLDKGFYLHNLLLSREANSHMSRTTNNESDDVDMQTLADDADSFGADVFISIHSNAANGSANYLLLLYRNGGDPPVPSTSVINTSLAMAKHAFPILLENPLNSWTAYYPYNPSNVKIDANNVNGVQRRMMIAGFLSEGSFHDYVPETCRLMNMDYKNLEAIRMFRHFVDYYNDAKETTGTLAGYVKTKDAKMQTVYGALSFVYHAGSDDQWKPLNGATVKLLDASGTTTLKTYTVDNEFNGIFVFYDLTPGNYKLQASIAGYTSETVDVTVTAAKTTNQKIFLKEEGTIEPDPDPVNYPDPVQDATVTALNHYDFEQQGTTSDAPWLNEGNIKRAIHRNGKLYVLSNVTTSPKISIYDASDLFFIKDMSLTGISGGLVSISDIAFTADDKLLACSKQIVSMPNDDRTFKTYIWDNDDAAPALYFEIASYAGANFFLGLVGETMAVSGPSWNSTMYLPVISSTPGGASEGVIRFATIEKAADVPPVAGFYGWADKGSLYRVENWGSDFQIMISPRADDCFIVTSNKVPPTELKLDKAYINNASPGGDVAVIRVGVFEEASGYDLLKTNGANYFRYAGQSYMAAPTADAGRVKAGVVLFDITDGLDQAVKLSEKLPEAGLGTAAAPYMTAYGVVNNKDIILSVLAENQGFATFKTDFGTGINAPKQQQSGVWVYPNPTRGIVQINCDFAITSIKLIDLTGRVIMNIPANQTSFDISGVAAGNYILLVNNSPVKIVKK